MTKTITPCLWFDDQAEEAAHFYTAIFRNSRITSVTRYGEEAARTAGRPASSVMTLAFELDGEPVAALNVKLDIMVLQQAWAGEN